jgi:hypothetical protein
VRSSASTVAVLVLLAAGSVAAAAPIDDAKRAFSEGKAAFERGDYEAALSHYQRANLILPAPNLYYNIGATYERLGRYQEAALAFDKYFEMAGAPQSDDDRTFQAQLRVRAESDRKQMNLPQRTAQQPPPVIMQQPQRQPPWIASPYLPAPGPSRELRLEQSKARRTRAIVLISIGGALSSSGVILTGYYGGVGAIDGWTRGFALWGGITAFVVGVTLWAPGASSFVHANHDIRELSQPEPLPPTSHGF